VVGEMEKGVGLFSMCVCVFTKISNMGLYMYL
jgi:hypothetical protein